MYLECSCSKEKKAAEIVLIITFLPHPVSKDLRVVYMFLSHPTCYAHNNFVMYIRLRNNKWPMVTQVAFMTEREL